MKVLVIGRGGREHAIVWKTAQSKVVTDIFAAPGNPGIASLATCVDIEETDLLGLVALAINEKIDLTIVGPEVPLSLGIVDAFEQEGLKVFGPRKNAAIIEGSKQFAKDLMLKYDIPTAKYDTFSDYEKAYQYAKEQGLPIVIKYDGLAAGKGVVVAFSFEEADHALKDMLLDEKYGDAKVVIEEYLEGPEFSLLTLVHNDILVPLEISQDHKRVFDNDLGPNTGGMGAYSSVPIIPDKDVKFAIESIMQKTIDAMINENRHFTGVLYGGLILTKEGPKVIEFNARFGDPETEVVLPKMESDLIETILVLLDGKKPKVTFKQEQMLGVVLASNGYPGRYEKGHQIVIQDSDNLVFHMGTKIGENGLETNGGRVLFVVGKGQDLKAARDDAYNGITKIKCDNLFYRKDIGYKSIN